ncbi:molybdenum cofactor guanylyltransferase [Agromyces allii]|uniref:MobA-like NTP transferase domain-containing protein n=1 Tax=Agromyces allii TaxID=393607 RepID=A0ABN2QL36_9MICO|nr:NTP transferase domain-containing protein [Agromyces allii]
MTTAPDDHATTDTARRPLDAVLLAGGRATRLGGASKPEQTVGGRTLLDLAIDAARRAGARSIVVVGPSSLTAPGCLVVREDPPFGGPVAAIAAALGALAALDGLNRSRSEASRDQRTPHDPDPDPDADADVLVLACDLPQAPAAAERLLAHRAGAPDGVCLVDADGRTQWLTAIYARRALDRAFAELDREPDGAAMRHLVASLELGEIADDGTAEDVDTWPDLDRARERADIRTSESPAPEARSTT